MTTIIINEKAKLEAEGVLCSKGTKPVICLDNGNRYTSATDAGRANGVGPDSISNTCLGKSHTSNGKHFCYVKNVDEHLETILNNLNKAVTENADLKRENLELTARNSELETENTRLRNEKQALMSQSMNLVREIKALREQPVSTEIPADILFKAKEYDRIMARRKAEEKRAKLEEMMRNLAMELEASTAELRALESESVA